MSFLFATIAAIVTAFFLHWTLENLHQKRITMYKEKYNEALASGDITLIMDIGKTYYAARQLPDIGYNIEIAIQNDITKYHANAAM